MHIREGILAKRFRPGDRIREVEIVSTLGVSRSPIREAFKVLAEEGLIVIEPWKGLAITTFSRKEMIEIFEYREILDGLAAELACQKIGNAELRKLNTLIECSNYNIDIDSADLARNNQEFHDIIYCATENEYLVRAAGTLRTLLSLLPAADLRERHRTESVLFEHRAIVVALEERDPFKAKHAAKTHVKNSADALLFAIMEADLKA